MAAISGAIAGIGLALSAGGAASSIIGAHGSAAAQQKQIGLEKQVEAQRMKAMELDARRKSLEIIRNQQRARSMALTSATSQGAQFGSGLQGGYGQIQGATNSNLSGVQQNLQIGRNIFGLNSQISDARIEQSQWGAMSATGAGLSSLGGSLLSNLGAIKSLSGGFGGGNPGGGFVSPFTDPSRRGSIY